jgi:hypothetical protein
LKPVQPARVMLRSLSFGSASTASKRDLIHPCLGSQSCDLQVIDKGPPTNLDRNAAVMFVSPFGDMRILGAVQYFMIRSLHVFDMKRNIIMSCSDRWLRMISKVSGASISISIVRSSLQEGKKIAHVIRFRVGRPPAATPYRSARLVRHKQALAMRPNLARDASPTAKSDRISRPVDPIGSHVTAFGIWRRS